MALRGPAAAAVEAAILGEPVALPEAEGGGDQDQQRAKQRPLHRGWARLSRRQKPLSMFQLPPCYWESPARYRP